MEGAELIIIGAGAAGLAAGIYGVRSGLRTLILEGKMAGGTTADAPFVENYLGFEGINGMELARRMVAHAKTAGVPIKEFERAISLSIRDEAKTVKTDKADYAVKAVVIASGSEYRKIGVPGEKEFRGRGVSYCGLCDGPFFKGKRVLVVGGGNSALITTLYLADIASNVQIVHRRDAFRAEEALVRALNDKNNIEVMWNTELKEIKGEKVVKRAALINNKTGETKEMPFDGVFVQIGESPNSQIAKEAGIAVDEDGYVIVDTIQHTNLAGIFAAGDVTNHPVKQIGTAVGQGITAATEAYAFIKRPYYKR
jgi:thioredoxin reductase (NADPH)